MRVIEVVNVIHPQSNDVKNVWIIQTNVFPPPV